MTSTDRLTKRRIDALTYPFDPTSNKAFYVPDHEVKRLYVRVNPSGRKTFVIRYRAGGRKRNLSLGTYGTLTLDQARREARKRLASVDLGGDPQAERQKRDAVPTFGEFADQYLDVHVKPLRGAREQVRAIEKHLRPRWGTRKLDSIGPADALQLRGDLEATPVWANRVLEIASSMFNRARKWGALPRTYLNPAADVPRFAEDARSRVASLEELAALRISILRVRSPYTRALFLLLLELPFRKTELMSARWDGYDEANQIISVRTQSATKSANPQPVPASAASILAALPRVDGNPHIFVGATRGQHLKNPATAWQRARARAGCDDLRIHDLRRTLATRAAKRGASEYQIQYMLGHSSGSSVAGKYYVHLALEANRQLLEDLSSELIGQADRGSEVGV